MDALDGSENAALAARLDELSRVCARLTEQNAELQLRVSQLSRASGPAAAWPAGASRARPTDREDRREGASDQQVSRRMMGKALGAAAAGVVGAVALAEATASPAAAATGDAVTAGHVTTAEAATTVKFDGTNPGVVFLAHDTALVATDAGHTAALAGWAARGQVANGVYGFTEVTGGDGVIGLIAASAGNAVHAIGSGDSTIALRAENDQGTAIFATSAGDAIESTAVLGRLTSTSPMTSAAAVAGLCNGRSAGGIGVVGSHAGQGRGVYGQCSQGVGVEGNGTIGVLGAAEKTGVKGSGPTGVRAAGSGTAGVGVNATGSGAGGRGGIFAGAAAQVQLAPGSGRTHPRSGKRGDLYADGNGRLWFCKKTGNPALWHQIA
jgi:hypothetical protein